MIQARSILVKRVRGIIGWTSLKGRQATGGHFSGLLFNLRLSIFS